MSYICIQSPIRRNYIFSHSLSQLFFRLSLVIGLMIIITIIIVNTIIVTRFSKKTGDINLGSSVPLSFCPSVRLSRFGFRALTALKIVRFHRNSVCKYTRTIVRLSSKANAIRAYVRILIRLLNSHWLIGFRALTALKIV